MSTCPTCGSDMNRLSNLIDRLLYNFPHEADELDFVYWCCNCGTIAHHTSNNGLSFFAVVPGTRRITSVTTLPPRNSNRLRIV